MQLSTIRSEVRRKLGNLTSDQYSDADINSAVNNYTHKAIQHAILSSGQWEVNGEVSVTDIVVGQQEYPLPANTINIKRIELNTTGQTDAWTQPILVDERNIAHTISNETTGNGSTTIRIFDNSLWLDTIPDTNVTGGIKVFISAENNALSADGDEPNVMEACVDYVIYGACLDYAVMRTLREDVTMFTGLLDKALAELKLFYSNRLPIQRPRITTRKEAYN